MNWKNIFEHLFLFSKYDVLTFLIIYFDILNLFTRPLKSSTISAWQKKKPVKRVKTNNSNIKKKYWYRQPQKQQQERKHQNRSHYHHHFLQKNWATPPIFHQVHLWWDVYIGEKLTKFHFPDMRSLACCEISSCPLNSDMLTDSKTV